MAKHLRLDHALVERELADTRSRAKALIMAGDVLVNDQRETRAGRNIHDDDVLSLREKPRFVSRGGEKLDHALDAFGIEVSGMVGADLGASTGGFTDCLLQRGATRVYAIDVGYGILDERIRTDPRVISMERTNARYLDALPEPIDICVIDVSFISLSLMFPVVARVLEPGGICVPLIKPQFEAGKENVGKRGVVRDPAIHEMVLRKAIGFARDNGLAVRGLVASPLRGPNGNVEFLAYLTLDERGNVPDEEDLVTTAMAEAAAVSGEAS
ncbi:MAG TPA: TlyA family RNA methyltransferase [Thermomicrobiales bacterium]|nr:TlyA family RNA methyltransferase [Thermomicrobiales bacterium]